MDRNRRCISETPAGPATHIAGRLVSRGQPIGKCETDVQ
jgi:hypothetical protein